MRHDARRLTRRGKPSCAAQTFTADVFCEARLRAVSRSPDDRWADQV
jgi:hypothetical protein